MGRVHCLLTMRATAWASIGGGATGLGHQSFRGELAAVFHHYEIGDNYYTLALVLLKQHPVTRAGAAKTIRDKFSSSVLLPRLRERRSASCPICKLRVQNNDVSRVKYVPHVNGMPSDSVAYESAQTHCQLKGLPDLFEKLQSEQLVEFRREKGRIKHLPQSRNPMHERVNEDPIAQAWLSALREAM